MKKVPKIFILFFSTFLIYNSLLHPNLSSLYTKNALMFVVDNIFPTLFPFIVSTNLLMSVDVIKKIKLPLNKIFNLSTETLFPIIIGYVSGQPLGAYFTNKLYENKKITKSEAEKLLGICNNMGPLFVISILGSIYSIAVGVVLYLIHIFGSILTGILFRNYNNPKTTLKNNNESLKEMKRNVISINDIIEQSIKTIMKISGIIIIFYIFTEFIPKSNSIFDSLISGFFEITKGIFEISQNNLPLVIKLTITSLLLSYSGVSIMLQIRSMLSKDLSMKLYILEKLVSSVLTSSITYFTFNKFENFTTFACSNNFNYMSLNLDIKYYYLILNLIILIIFLKKVSTNIK